MRTFLTQFEVLRTPEPDPFLELMRSKGIAAQVSARAPDHRPDFSLSKVDTRSGTYFGWLCYGRDVTLGMAEGRESFAVSLPAGGRLRSRIRGEDVEVDAGQALFGPADHEQWLDVGSDCSRFYISVDQAAFQRAHRDWSHSHRPPCDLPHVLDLHRGSGVALGRFARFALEELSGCSPRFVNAVAHHLESLLYLALLRVHDTAVERPVCSGPVPAGVKRALDYIHAHAGGNVTVEDVLNAAETPGRTLYRQFEHFVGMAPAVYLRNHRLDLAHRILASSAGAQVTVQRVALDLGFGNLGRFARVYRERHGELPSATLARARGIGTP